MPKNILVTPIFKKPVGPSKHLWNNTCTGTSGDVICELCGTLHKGEQGDDYNVILDRFLGMQVVEECCGRIFDIIYAELGQEIVTKFLEDFAENPTDPRFREMLDELPEAIEKVRKKIGELLRKTDGISEGIAEIAKTRKIKTIRMKR